MVLCRCLHVTSGFASCAVHGHSCMLCKLQATNLGTLRSALSAQSASSKAGTLHRRTQRQQPHRTYALQPVPQRDVDVGTDTLYHHLRCIHTIGGLLTVVAGMQYFGIAKDGTRSRAFAVQSSEKAVTSCLPMPMSTSDRMRFACFCSTVPGSRCRGGLSERQPPSKNRQRTPPAA